MPHIRIIMAAIKVAGAAGFVGLLVASHYLPAIATALRIAALAWLFGSGAVYGVVQSKCPPPPRCRSDPIDPGILRSD